MKYLEAINQSFATTTKRSCKKIGKHFLKEFNVCADFSKPVIFSKSSKQFIIELEQKKSRMFSILVNMIVAQNILMNIFFPNKYLSAKEKLRHTCQHIVDHKTNAKLILKWNGRPVLHGLDNPKWYSLRYSRWKRNSQTINCNFG